MQAGRLLVTDRARGDRPTAIRVRSSPSAARDVLGLLGALRRFPHARAVWPFGEALHYTDARGDAPPELVARELAEHVAREGLADVTLTPIPASIEDAFMWYMAQESAA